MMHTLTSFFVVRINFAGANHTYATRNVGDLSFDFSYAHAHSVLV